MLSGQFGSQDIGITVEQGAEEPKQGGSEADARPLIGMAQQSELDRQEHDDQQSDKYQKERRTQGPITNVTD